MPKTPKRIRREVVLPRPPAAVWLALTDRNAIAEWLMPNDFEPVIGRTFRLQVDPMWKFSGINECKVLEVDPPHRLVYSWVVVPSDPKTPRHEPMVLTWTLSAEGGGTRLVLEQEGIENIGLFYRLSMAMGWGRYIRSLLPKVLRNVEDGRFTPGAIPLRRRCYSARRVPENLTR